MEKRILRFIILFFMGTLGAQTAIDGSIPKADYDGAIPTNEEFPGYPPGVGLTTNRAAVGYLRGLQKLFLNAILPSPSLRR